MFGSFHPLRFSITTGLSKHELSGFPFNALRRQRALLSRPRRYASHDYYATDSQAYMLL